MDKSNLPDLTGTAGHPDFDNTKMHTVFDTSDFSITRKGTPLWGHSLEIEKCSVSCNLCGMEKEIPDLVMEGPPGRVAIYRAVLLGQFKHSSCDRTAGFMNPNPGTVVGGIDGEYRYTGNDKWVEMSPPHDTYSTQEFVDKQRTKKQRLQRDHVTQHGDPVLGGTTTGAPKINDIAAQLDKSQVDDLKKHGLIKKMTETFK